MKRFFLVIATLAAIPLAAQAGDLDYSYIQAGYDYAHNDPAVSTNPGHDNHGWGGTASAAIGEHFNAFGGGGVTDYDGSGTIRHYWNLGGGFHTPISGRTDFVTDLTYRHGKADGTTGDIKTYSGEVGVRSALAQKVEGWAMVGYSDARNQTNDIDRGTSGSAFGKLGGQYKFTKNFGLVAEGTLSDKDRGIFVGPRVSF